MSYLQRSFAKSILSNLPPDPIPRLDERDETTEDSIVSTSPDDSSSSASSVDSTDTVIPSNLLERPRGTATRSRLGPLPWNDFFAQELTFNSPSTAGLTHHAYFTPPSSTGPLIVTHHGAGSSGLSFAAFFKSLSTILPQAGILSLDCRGHGLTTGSPLPLELSLPTLAADIAFVVNATAEKFSWPRLPPILLLGHSLGGAVVTEVAHTQLLGPSLLGYGVLDVVEGSAMDALQSMESYLSTRPASFSSIPSAIEWHTRSRTIRNTTSARPFWSSWFTGLSSKFLSSPGGKLLILAGTDRLDKELMIGQMQGKYQLQIFPEAGHFLHEDQPLKTAQIVADFFKRNDRSTLVLPKKVDQLIAEGKVKASGYKS
ncbi:hypothetical protein DV738_g2377, partial [Chaetothyriales sp. CBS 135597]